VIKDPGKLSAAIDEVPDLIVEECLKFMKKPQTDICNALMDLAIFLDGISFVIVVHLHKKGHAEYTPLHIPLSPVSVI